MKRLTSKNYWNNYHNHYGTSKIVRLINLRSKKSLYYRELTRIIKPYIKSNSKIIEVGCAPGNSLIKISRLFKLQPYGVEYTKRGVETTRDNFKRNNFDPKNIFYADFFSKKFQKENQDKYDIVSSFGFIEHFDDASKVIDSHLNILKKGGTLIISIPNFNLKIRNRLLFSLISKKTMDMYNFSIMEPDNLRKVTPNYIKINELRYYGNQFENLLFSFIPNSENIILRYFKIFLLLLTSIFQKLLVDPLLIVISLFNLNMHNKYFSQSFILIGTKNSDNNVKSKNYKE